MRRRNFLLGSVYVSASFAEPALFALTVPPAPSTAHVGAGRRIGTGDVEFITETVRHFEWQARRFGAERVRPQLVQFLHREADTALHGTYTEQVGRSLFNAVAQATRSAGSMAVDVGRHALAQRYYVQALNLALGSDDRLYAANVLGDMSRLAIHIGQGSPTELAAVRNGRQGVALARAARSLAAERSTPVLSTLLCAVEARGFALLGDRAAASAAIDAAQRHFDQSQPDREPEWLSHYGHADLAVEVAWCLRETGRADRAVPLVQQALDSYEPHRIRAHALVQTDMALVHLARREFEQTASVACGALCTASMVSSAHVVDRLRVLQRRVRSYGQQRETAELDERISDFLTHTSRDETPPSDDKRDRLRRRSRLRDPDDDTVPGHPRRLDPNAPTRSPRNPAAVPPRSRSPITLIRWPRISPASRPSAIGAAHRDLIHSGVNRGDWRCPDEPDTLRPR